MKSSCRHHVHRHTCAQTQTQDRALRDMPCTSATASWGCSSCRHSTGSPGIAEGQVPRWGSFVAGGTTTARRGVGAAHGGGCCVHGFSGGQGQSHSGPSARLPVDQVPREDLRPPLVGTQLPGASHSHRTPAVTQFCQPHRGTAGFVLPAVTSQLAVTSAGQHVAWGHGVSTAS